MASQEHPAAETGYEVALSFEPYGVSPPFTHVHAPAPTAPAQREAILDALRGFAVLGILLINIEVMRGPEWLVLMAGGQTASVDISDAIVQFLVGWLGTAKFISSLAILFGVGAALIASRSLAEGRSPRPLLARRYVSLTVFGAVHMFVFPGDILFMYGLTGFALLAFVQFELRAVLVLSGALLIAYAGLALASTAPASPDTGDIDENIFDSVTDALREQTVAAYAHGTFADILAAHAGQALLLQTAQLLALPWILALFLFGYALARAGLLSSLGERRTLLRRGAWIGLAVGLPANIGVGFFGALAGFGARPELDSPLLTRWADFGQVLGAPILAAGYLCALSLYFASRGAPPALVAVGRMTLTAYLLQSVLALAVFGGLRLYDRLSSTSALLVVAAIWALLLLLCPLWLRYFSMGPAEWLWRSLTYRRWQPLRRAG